MLIRLLIGIVWVFYVFTRNSYFVSSIPQGDGPEPVPGPPEPGSGPAPGPAPVGPGPRPQEETGGNTPVFEFGNPEIFVTTESQNFSPYRFINKYKRTYLMDEYVIYAKGITSFTSYLILYDGNAPDVVTQNLGKEQYWAFVNSTGALPTLSASNSTFSKPTHYKAEANNHISFVATYTKSFISRETTPAYDLVFEIPGQSRTFLTKKTVIDYQSWGLIRWQLSDQGFVTWNDIQENVEALRPSYPDPKEPKPEWTVSASSFQRIDNPCLPDLFLLYVLVGDKKSTSQQVFLDIPAFHLDDESPNFLNLTGSFCPHHKEISHEECGYIQQILLTNDHLVGLTDKGVYVSTSLNSSDKDVSSDYIEKPLISYDLIDPCSKFADFISCFKHGITSLSSELIHSVRLFYTPVCNLFQYPHYDDMIIFVVEHTTTQKSEGSSKNSNPPVRTVTVLYASTPYKEWKALFIGIDKYATYNIAGLVGIFYNHQLRHFDVTLKVVAEDNKSYEYRRFVLPEVVEEDNKRNVGHPHINGIMGKGFLEKKFPGTFQLDHVFFNSGPMDVFFVGSQLWIAESGLSLVYTSVAGLSDRSEIRHCHFNHLDRIFVCVNSNNMKLIVGRVGTQYSPILVDVESIEELWEAAGIRGSYWTQEYAEAIIKRAIYTAPFSGKVLMWYLFDPEELKASQKRLVDPPIDCDNPGDRCTKCTPNNQLTQACNQLKKKYEENPGGGGGRFEPRKDGSKDIRGPYFRMIAINPHKLEPVKESTEGPLVPMYVDAQSVLLFEGKLPGDDAEHVYLSSVYIGQEIDCLHDATDPRQNCKFFVRHIKPVHKFLQGFRQVLYGTLIKPIALVPVPSEVVILQIPRSNTVLLLLQTASYTEDHVGQTHHFPGNFSVLLQGFPEPGKLQLMWGFATVHVRKEKLRKVDAYYSYLIDMSTKAYRTKRLKPSPFSSSTESADQIEWKAFEESLKNEQEQSQEIQNKISKAKKDTQAMYDEKDPAKNPCSPFSNQELKMFLMPEPVIVELYKPVDVVEKDGKGGGSLLPVEKREDSWIVADGGCNHILQLMPNKMLVGHGGRISLDLHDAISFKVIIRPKTELGRMLMYRPLLVVTNSNPEILNVEKRYHNDKHDNTQSISVMLTPTGAKMGVASFVIRSVIASLKCTTTTSISYIVQIHRAQGRRLHINYPKPICKLPPTMGGYARPWKVDPPDCILNEAILEVADDPDEEDYPPKESDSASITILTKLKPNYRPPSVRGEQIPLSHYTYNADPEQESYNNWYHISNDTRKLRKCSFRKKRDECECSIADKLSDDPEFSDCKVMVYQVQRAKSFSISVEYDPIMKAEDQDLEFFQAKDHLSVYIEEINLRREFTITSGILGSPSAILKAINDDSRLNEGKVFYNAEMINITLHGTGLYHFKVGLGRFDSFEKVTGYFILYSESNELNHVKLVVVMLLTITFCFSLIFFGFIRVRRRLSSQLPFQSNTKSKFKLE